MGIVSRLADRLKSIGRRKLAEEVRIEAEKGRVLLQAKDIRVRMELFKLYPKRRAWGFELLVENRGEKDLAGVVIWFTHSKHATLERLPAGKIALRSVELSFDEVPLADWEVGIERAAGNERLSSHFIVPLQAVFGKLRQAGKVDVIEEGEVEQKARHVAMAWTSHPSAKHPIGGEKQRPQDVQARLKELENEKGELARQFMRRQVDYQGYSQLMNTLNKEMLELKAKAGEKNSLVA